MGLNFEWDAKKGAANLRKHGVSFEEAASAFGDPLSLTISDPERSHQEERRILLGLTERQRLVVVAHTEQGDTSASSTLGLQRQRRDMTMKNAKGKARGRNLLPEYDFSHGTRGKYANRFATGTNLVKLEPDVAKVFRDSASVNRALRRLASQVSRKRAV